MGDPESVKSGSYLVIVTYLGLWDSAQSVPVLILMEAQVAGGWALSRIMIQHEDGITAEMCLRQIKSNFCRITYY